MVLGKGARSLAFARSRSGGHRFFVLGSCVRWSRLAPPWAGLAPLALALSPGFAARPARTAGKPAFPAGAPLATVSSYFMVILWPLNAALREGRSVGRGPPSSLHRFANSRHFFGGLAKLVQAGVGEMVGGGDG